MRMRFCLILGLCLFLIASFATLPRNPLLNDDAALYALAVKNAIVHNMWLAQFVTPGDLSSFLDKPPLGIWLLAWLPKAFGVNELTIHFPNLIYYLILLFFLFLFLSHFAGRKLALNATLIAATSLCLVVYSRAPKLDVLLTLFVFTAHISLYALLKKNNPSYLIPFSLSLALGFLTKAGFGILFPTLTILFLFTFNAIARKKLLNLLSTLYFPLSIILFVALVGTVLALQSTALKNQFIPYLKSITIQSKYNVGYLGLGFHYSIIGFLLITIFPWSPLWLTAIRIPRFRKRHTPLPLGEGSTPHTGRVRAALNLSTFCNLWFWSNIFFLLFFYRQNDLRTFTIFVPPLAILAGLKMLTLSRKKSPIHWDGFLWGLFFLVIFSIISIAIILNPVNPQGFSLKAAILPFVLFTLSLIPLTSYLWKPTPTKFATTFLLVCLSYCILFYNTKPIAEAFNPDISWPKIIKKQKQQGAKFFIYRPPDRKLFYSPDLCWVDFMAGPADKYFWDKNKLQKELAIGKAIILSDTESWNKIRFRQGKIIAQDNYSSLILR